MSGVAPCAPPGVTGVTLNTTTSLCNALDEARKVDLLGPSVTPPTPVIDEMMPDAMKKAMTDCSGVSSCKFIGYDFDSDVATKAASSRYVVDTYSTTAENSGVLVLKGKKTTGTVSSVTPDATTGGSTGTVTYTADNGQTYTFQGRWRSVQTSGSSVDVYFDPANTSKGALRPEDLGFAPPVLVQPPGYELPDFQSTVVTAVNTLGTPAVASVEECAEKCDSTTGCTGFNFGGLDTSTICELVKDTTTREYADNKSGFRKETISSTQTGDGSNPSGTDFTNEGAYCRDAPACNTDIARIITDNTGATNPIATLSTSDIESCAYCPIRTYAAAGNVTTNEIGVSKSNPTPAAAITELQYSTDGTSATHITLENGRLYRMKTFFPRTTAGTNDYDINVIAISKSADNTSWNFVAANSGALVNLDENPFGGSITSGLWLNISFTLVPVDYVTNGFRLLAQTGQLYGGNSSRLSTEYNKYVYVFTPISFETFMNSLPGTSFVQYNSQNVTARPSTPNPFIYSKPNGDTYKIDINTATARKFPERLMLDWYLELNPLWRDWVTGFTATVWIAYSQSYESVYVPRNTILPPIFWDTVITYGEDMPDPYAALGQFRTLDAAPPSTSQTWAYNRRQGCDKNCGNTLNGYAIYRCTASGGGNCDPGKGAYVSGPVCDSTHISCRPPDDSVDLKAQFSFKFRGLLPTSTKVISGGGNTPDHDTNALAIRTIYSLDSSFSVSVTPNESIQKLYTIFPSFVIDRILRTPELVSLVPAAMCPPGTYVRDYGFGIKACELCPGNPTLASNQVFQPDTVNPGNFLCTVITCPTGQTRDLLTNRCRTPCQPGQYVAADGTCATCPDQTLAGDQYWIPDITNIGSSTCVKNQCTGNQYVNVKKTGCNDKCFPGYGPDPVNPGRCTQCTVTPARLQVWVSETLGPVGGQTTSYKCDLTTCSDGQVPPQTNDVCSPCAQLTGLPIGVTTTFGQGCQVKACLVDPASPSVASASVVAPTVIPPANCGDTACTPVGSCALVCKPGFTGPACTPCPQPPGIKATYSTACIATSCSVDTSSPDASKVSGATVVNGNCIVSCSPSFWKYLEYGCYACGTRTGDDPLTTRTYSQNSCDPVSCTVDASLVGKATAAPATVPGTNTSVCMLTPVKGYAITSSTSVTGDYISIAGPFDFRTMSFTRSAASTISACLVGDAGTTYTYSSGCSLATCSYTNANDVNETASIIISSSGVEKCTKVCKAGYKRDTSGKCTVACPQPSDLGLTATFGPYGCKISACKSSSGFQTSITPTGGYGTDAYIYGDTCAIACPVGARQYTNTNASPIRQDCAKCSTDLSLNPWIFSSTCALITGYCATYGPMFQLSPWSRGESVTTATATQTGSVCTTACTAGYVKDSYGVCRKCPNETPSSTSVVVNGVCVTTCKTNHTRDVSYDAKEFDYSTQQRFESLFGVQGRTSPAGLLNQSEIVCPQCTNGTTWDTYSMKCINCSTASTVSTTITSACTMQCKPGYYYNRTTGSCDSCPAGSYCTGGTGVDQNVTRCPAGTYCPSGSTKTTVCSAGYSCPAGSGSQTACNLTPASGYIWSNPGVDCTTTQCPVGWYCLDAVTKNGCYDGDYCPAGTTSASHQCPAGYYCPNTGTKTQCDVGYSCPVASRSQTSCGITLSTGYIWKNPRVDCTYSQCSAGYYCPDSTTETLCSSSYYCPAGSTSQTTLYATLGQACYFGWSDIPISGYPCTAKATLVYINSRYKWQCPSTGAASVNPPYSLLSYNGITYCGMSKVSMYVCNTGTSVNYVVSPPICS